GPSPKAREVVESRTDRIHVYPDGAAHDLHKALSEFHDRPKDEIIWGNGSDQLLRLAVHAFTRQGEDRGIVSEHSFGAYPIALKSGGVAVDAVGMTGDLEYDLQGMREAVVDDTRMVFIANPNNPTGTYLGGEALRAFLDDLPSDVVALVDEAYYQYARADDYASALTMRDAHERLIVTRTFSKCYGLAGLRVGYAVTTPEITDALNRIRDPFNCNRLGQRAAIAALDDRDFVERSVEVNERGREQLEEGLRGLAGRGVDWTPSQ
ncbi:MAG: histidinol-phosphate transaminase, partial [Bradymonadaceae bacterium]